MIEKNDLSEDILAAAQRGDRAAYEAVLHGSALVLARYFSRKIFAGSGLEADDLIQDCLLAVHAKWHTYDSARPYVPWLRAIAAHKLVDALRRRRQVHVSLDVVEGWLAAPEVAGPSSLGGLLRSLPPAQREAIERVKLCEQTVAQAASMMGRSEGSIKQLVHRGLLAMRKKVSS